MGKTEIETRSKHNQHSIVVVPKHSEGISVIRPLVTFGYDDAPNGHAEVRKTLQYGFEDWCSGYSNLI